MAVGPVLMDGGLASLTALNRRLIAQTVEGSTATADAADDGSIFGAGGGEYDPETDDEPTPEVRGRFSTVDPFEYNRVKEWIEQNIFGGSGAGRAELIGDFVDEWDREYRERQGWTEEQFIGDGATLEGLLEMDDFLNGAIWLPLTATNDVPPVFESETTTEDGQVVPLVGVANPLTGVQFVEVTQTVEALRDDPKSLANLITHGSDVVVQGIEDQLKASAERVAQERPGFVPRYSALTSRALTGQTKTPIPVISTEELTNALASKQPSSTSSTSTTRDLVFDRDHLIAQVEDLWDRRMLSADPAPRGLIESWVDGYTRDAGAFWSQKGGQLDFNTFIERKLEGHPRYQTIYKDKIPGETPEQYLQKFMAPIASLGQTSEFTRAQTEAAILSGAGPAEQFKRVQKTREVTAGSGFSQKFAQTLAGIGVG